MWFSIIMGVTVGLPFALFFYLILVEAPAQYRYRVRPRQHGVMPSRSQMRAVSPRPLVRIYDQDNEPKPLRLKGFMG